MTQPNEKSRDAPPPTAKPDTERLDAGAETGTPVPVRRVDDKRKKTPPKAKGAAAADDRRDFFSEAMRETLAPFAGILERKINPLLAALEAIPGDVERLTGAPLPASESAVVGAAGAVGASQGARFLKPPGAVPGGRFEALCTLCEQCVYVCPAHAIQLDQYGLTGTRLPCIIPSAQPCVVCEGLSCMKECPTGALTLVDRLKIRMGTARVNRELCVRENGEDCRKCVEICPIMGEGAGAEGGALFIHEASGRVRVRRRVCVGCGLCESRCPTYPAAITVEPWRENDPIVA